MLRHVLVLLAVLGSVSPAPAEPGARCTSGVDDAGFEAGGRADGNLLPEAYFRDPRVGRRPRLVLMKGLPGSSKFLWSRAAEHFGWIAIALDEYRDRVIAQKVLRGVRINARGGWRDPNPLDPYHRLAVTEEAAQLAKQDYERALAAGKPVVWEGVFDQPRYRAELLTTARRYGYTTECLSFDTDDVEINLGNIVDRLHIGGRDLTALGQDEAAARSERTRILTRMQSNMRTRPIAVHERRYRIFGEEPSDYAVESAAPFIQANDYVNRIARVPVVRWREAMPPLAGVPWSVLSRQVILRPERFRETALFRNGKRVRVVGLDADSNIRYARSNGVSARHHRDVIILPGVAERIRRWNEEGALVVIFSNQAGIPRHISHEEADGALRYTAEILWQAGARIDYVDYAEEGSPNRKPNRGFLDLLAARIRQYIHPDAVIDMETSIFVGDSAYAAGDEPPDGRTWRDHSNADRLFAVNTGLTYYEPDHPEAFDWWRRWRIRRFESSAQIEALLREIAASTGRR